MSSPGRRAHATPTYTRPSVTVIDPVSGPVGTPVTLTGAGFNSPGFGVTIGGTAVESLVVVSSTSATAVVPAGLSTGAKDVVITTKLGTATLAAGYEVTAASPPPDITSVIPNNCPKGTPTSLTLAGTGFTGATGAIIRDETHGGSDQDLESFTVVSDIAITCDYPASISDAQVTFIRVTGPGGSDTIPFTLT